MVWVIEMNFNFVMLAVFLTIPLIIYSDYKSIDKTKENNSEFCLAATPLLALFFTAQFYYALLMLMLLFFYGVGLKIVAHKYRWVKFDLQLMKNHCIGSVGWLVVGYASYKFYLHMFPLNATSDQQLLGQPNTSTFITDDLLSILSHWSYLSYGALIVVILLATLVDRMPERQDKEEFSLFVVLFIIPASLVLPWCSTHFWWFLLATFIFMPLVVFFVYGYKEDDKQEAKDITILFTFVYFGLSHVNVLFYWLFS